MSGVPLTEQRFEELFEKNIQKFLNPVLSELYIIKTDISGMKADISVLKTDVSILKTDVSILKTDVSVLKTDVSILKTDVSVLKTDVSVLKTDVSVLKTEMSTVKNQITQLTKFQKNESDAIEYELRKILQKYLTKQYPINLIHSFEIKNMKDPVTDKVITDLDSAFTIHPIVPKLDIKRIADAGLPYIANPKYDSRPTIFVVAEAKHYLHKGKIAKKMGQFDIIISLFEAAKELHNAEINALKSEKNNSKESKTDTNSQSENDMKEDKKPAEILYFETICKKYSQTFLETVKTYDELTNIQSYVLFFGASFWDKNLMDDFEKDVARRKDLVNNWNASTTNEQKIKVYRNIRNLEKIWYCNRDNKTQLPPDYNLPDAEILQLSTIRGAMGHVQFILPSGERYHVNEDTHEVKPVATYPIGGRRTYRRRKSND